MVTKTSVKLPSISSRQLPSIRLKNIALLIGYYSSGVLIIPGFTASYKIYEFMN